MSSSRQRRRWPRRDRTPKARMLRRTREPYNFSHRKRRPTRGDETARATERDGPEPPLHRLERTSHEANSSDSNRAPCGRACARRHGMRLRTGKTRRSACGGRRRERAGRRSARRRNPGPARSVGIPCGSGKSVVFLRARRSDVGIGDVLVCIRQHERRRNSPAAAEGIGRPRRLERHRNRARRSLRRRGRHARRSRPRHSNRRRGGRRLPRVAGLFRLRRRAAPQRVLRRHRRRRSQTHHGRRPPHRRNVRRPRLNRTRNRRVRTPAGREPRDNLDRRGRPLGARYA